MASKFSVLPFIGLELIAIELVDVHYECNDHLKAR